MPYAKKLLPARLEMDLMDRLNRVSSTRKISVNDVISLALDGLEGEREVAQTITDRIEFLEKPGCARGPDRSFEP